MIDNNLSLEVRDFSRRQFENIDKSFILFRCGHRFHKSCILEINNPDPKNIKMVKEMT